MKDNSSDKVSKNLNNDGFAAEEMEAGKFMTKNGIEISQIQIKGFFTNFIMKLREEISNLPKGQSPRNLLQTISVIESLASLEMKLKREDFMIGDGFNVTMRRVSDIDARSRENYFEDNFKIRVYCSEDKTREGVLKTYESFKESVFNYLVQIERSIDRNVTKNGVFITEFLVKSCFTDFATRLRDKILDLPKGEKGEDLLKVANAIEDLRYSRVIINRQECNVGDSFKVSIERRDDKSSGKYYWDDFEIRTYCSEDRSRRGEIETNRDIKRSIGIYLAEELALSEEMRSMLLVPLPDVRVVGAASISEKLREVFGKER